MDEYERTARAIQAAQPAGPSPEDAQFHLREAFVQAHTPRAGSGLLIALDIDGTILHLDTSISERVAQAIAAHRAAGTHIVLATGRGIYATQLAAATCGIDSGMAVCSNGTITIELGVGKERCSDGTGVPYTIHTYRHFDSTHAICTLREAMPTALLAVERRGGPRLVSELFPPGELAGPCTVVPFDELLIPDATRVTVRAIDMTADEMRECVKEAGLRGVDYAIGWSAWLDIFPAGISKAFALDDIRRSLNLPVSACVAVGDGSNDIEMLQWAGVGIAMGGANSEVKAAADVVTTSVSQDGLAEVLELLLDT